MRPDIRRSRTLTIELEPDEAYELERCLLRDEVYDSIAWPLGRVLRKLRAAL